MVTKLKSLPVYNKRGYSTNRSICEEINLTKFAHSTGEHNLGADFKGDPLHEKLKLKLIPTSWVTRWCSDEAVINGQDMHTWQSRTMTKYQELTGNEYIYLGGEEAKSKGYTVVKSTGVRNRTSLNIDENGIHSLFVNDIYERVWPEVILSLETYGVKILSAKEDDGIIYVSVSEQKAAEKSFLSSLAFWKTSENIDAFNIVLISKQDGTLIEVQNDAYMNFTNAAAEEVIRALYASLR